MQEIFRTCFVVANVKAQENEGQLVSAQDLHRILDAAMAGVTMTSTPPASTGYQPPSLDWQQAGQHSKRQEEADFWRAQEHDL